MNKHEVSVGQSLCITPYGNDTNIVGKICSIDRGTFTVDCSGDEYSDGEELFITFAYGCSEDVTGSYELAY